MSLAAAILAGGQGRRLGGVAKPLVVVDGERIIDRQLRVLRALSDEIVISANQPELYAGLGWPLVADETAGQGPLGGLLAVLEHVQAEHVLIVAGDMPFLALEPLRRLVAGHGDIVAPRGEPLCARYSRAVAPVVRRRLAAGQRRAVELLEDAALSVALLDFDDRRFLTNVNTPGDLAV